MDILAFQERLLNSGVRLGPGEMVLISKIVVEMFSSSNLTASRFDFLLNIADRPEILSLIEDRKMIEAVKAIRQYAKEHSRGVSLVEAKALYDLGIGHIDFPEFKRLVSTAMR